MADRLFLVVEGPDDKHVILALVTRHDFKPEFKVQDEGGYGTLFERLSPRLKPGSDLERFGIVVDADADIVSRWQSLKGVLGRAGYADLPDHPDPAGTVVNHETLPRLGVWIMPDNVLPGMLEDYMAFLVPADDALMERARRCLDTIPAEDRRFAEIHRPKALIHTWLSWQEDPGTPLGQAITKRYFDSEARHASAFIAWLSRLFT